MYLIDGGLSTELERLGADFGGPLWTGHAILDASELVEQAHRNFIAAGAEVIITASYQVSRTGFAELGIKPEVADATLRKSIELARTAAAGTSTKVAASVGPYAAVLHDGSEYRGHYSVSQSQLEDFHAERIQVLLQAKPDLLAIETIPNVIEASALASVLATVDVPFWFCFTAATGSKLHSGEHIQDAVEAVAPLANLLSVGVNCVNPSLIADLVSNIHAVSNKAVTVYPNRGGTWDSEKGEWLNPERSDLADWLPDWKDLPIGWIGGCCGTDSHSIQTLKTALQPQTRE